MLPPKSFNILPSPYLYTFKLLLKKQKHNTTTKSLKLREQNKITPKQKTNRKTPNYNQIKAHTHKETMKPELLHQNSTRQTYRRKRIQEKAQV